MLRYIKRRPARKDCSTPQRSRRIDVANLFVRAAACRDYSRAARAKRPDALDEALFHGYSASRWRLPAPDHDADGCDNSADWCTNPERSAMLDSEGHSDTVLTHERLQRLAVARLRLPTQYIGLIVGTIDNVSRHHLDIDQLVVGQALSKRLAGRQPLERTGIRTGCDSLILPPDLSGQEGARTHRGDPLEGSRQSDWCSRILH